MTVQAGGRSEDHSPEECPGVLYWSQCQCHTSLTPQSQHNSSILCGRQRPCASQHPWNASKVHKLTGEVQKVQVCGQAAGVEEAEAATPQLRCMCMIFFFTSTDIYCVSCCSLADQRIKQKLKERMDKNRIKNSANLRVCFWDKCCGRLGNNAGDTSNILT